MSHFLFKHRNYKRLSFQFARLFVLGTFFSFFLFDKILVFMIEKVSFISVLLQQYNKLKLLKDIVCSQIEFKFKKERLRKKYL